MSTSCLSPHLRRALTTASEDQLIYDLTGIEERYDTLVRELPGVTVRFAMKACPVDEVLAVLARKGAGFDAASPNEIRQALRTGVPAGRIHYGNTIKSDHNMVDAHRLGVRDFATDSLEDVAALAVRAPGARVFCRLATTGDGALWGLGGKCGCSVADTVRVMAAASDLGLTPSGVSIHVGSQQMTAAGWQDAIGDLVHAVTELTRRGVPIDHVNLGGGLPALGYLDRRGRPLRPPLTAIFDAIRTGIRRLRQASRTRLEVILEPGRYLVADSGAIRAHVSRLSARQQRDGVRQPWLYLSCGRFNGLYEMDQLQYRLVFPGHTGGEYVPAVIAGPTCDGDDAFGHEHGRVLVPMAVASGDPVWILSSGAYAVSYTTVGFNGFDPLPLTTTQKEETDGVPDPAHSGTRLAQHRPA